MGPFELCLLSGASVWQLIFSLRKYSYAIVFIKFYFLFLDHYLDSSLMLLILLVLLLLSFPFLLFFQSLLHIVL